MPWKGVTVSEQRENFIRDWQLSCYNISELAERFSISRKTAYKWIERYQELGRNGMAEQSRRPHSCPWQTEEAVTAELLRRRRAHPYWGPAKLLRLIKDGHEQWQIPAVSTAARILAANGLVVSRRRYRRAHPGCPKSEPAGPNDIWGADYKGQFRLGDGSYCYPQTVSDLDSRYLLGCDAHPEISLPLTKQHFTGLFLTYGLPNRIRTDNGCPFASNALARLSALSVWFIKLGIYPELIEPGRPQQNGVHERMHRTLKQEATKPPASSLGAQQRKFAEFRRRFNEQRPHEALGQETPASVYRPSTRPMPSRLPTYDYPLHYLVRRVSRCGTIRVAKHQFFVSQTLNEDYVGLEEVDDGIYDMYFCFYQIGRYELRTNTVHDIVSKVPMSRSRPDRPA